MVHWGWLVLVLYIGATFGFFAAALLHAAKIDEEDE